MDLLCRRRFRQPGLGDSAQLWNNMIAAGYNNPSYDMADGARFLEALSTSSKSSTRKPAWPS